MATYLTKTSGYLTTPIDVTWNTGQAQPFNALTNDEWTSTSDPYDNSITKYYLCDIEIDLASAAFTGADATIDCYLLPSVDGTTYPTWTGNVTTEQQHHAQYYVGTCITTGSTSAQSMVIRNVQLPPGLFVFSFRNRANVSLAASGNSVKWRPHTLIGTDV